MNASSKAILARLDKIFKWICRSDGGPVVKKHTSTFFSSGAAKSISFSSVKIAIADSPAAARVRVACGIATPFPSPVF